MSDGAGESSQLHESELKRARTRRLIGGGIAVSLILIAGIVAGVTLTGSDDGARTGPSGERIFKVELGEMYVKPSKITVKPGDKVLVEVTNVGEGDHDLKIDGSKGTPILAPQEKATADFGTVRATTQAWCTIPEHRAAGMVMDVEVKA